MFFICKKLIAFVFLQLLFSSLLFSQTWSLGEGWHLIGSDSKIDDMTKIKTSCVNKIYVYNKGGASAWLAYPGDLTSIKKGQGLWIQINNRRCKINTDLLEDPNKNGELSLATLDLNGATREYRFYKPNNLSDDASLMFFFHGSLIINTNVGNLDSLKDGLLPNKQHIFNELARTENMMIVYPLSTIRDYGEGRKNGSWGHSDTEVAYFDALVDHFLSTYPKLSNKKIYVSGHSSGAIFSFKLAGERAKIVAGAGAVSSRFNLMKEGKLVDGVDFINDSLSTPLIAFRGLNDDRTYGMEESVDVWHTTENKGTLNDATKEDVEVEQYYTTKKTYKNGISDIELYLIKDEGHSVSWSAISKTMWDFLKSHTR